MTSNNLSNKIAQAKNASDFLLTLSKWDRKNILLSLAKRLRRESAIIIRENKKDIASAQKHGHRESFIERLELDAKKIDLMACKLADLAGQKDIIFKSIENKKMSSGINIQKISFPLGLIAMIYESRSDVTIDAFTMAFKSGNAIILKGGKEIVHTNKIIVATIRKVLKEFSIDEGLIQDFSGIDKKMTLQLISDRRIDCLIPRGGKNLIDFIRKNAKIPTIITGASVVHAFIDESADLEIVTKVVINAKTRRISTCNALDVVVIHKKIYQKALDVLAPLLADGNVIIRADKSSHAYLRKIKYDSLQKASNEDFDIEFLSNILAVKIVENLDEAINHIKKHSLGHSELIITQLKKNAEIFFQEVDAACLYWNTSTQFSDGGEFGMGGEIGISTQKLHARGPFAYQQLTTYKYLIRSSGAVRK